MFRVGPVGDEVCCAWAGGPAIDNAARAAVETSNTVMNRAAIVFTMASDRCRSVSERAISVNLRGPCRLVGALFDKSAVFCSLNGSMEVAAMNTGGWRVEEDATPPASPTSPGTQHAHYDLLACLAERERSRMHRQRKRAMSYPTGFPSPDRAQLFPLVYILPCDGMPVREHPPLSRKRRFH